VKPFTGPFDRDAAAHLLRRLGDAPLPSAVDRAVRDGLSATLDRLLAPPPRNAADDARDAALRASEDRELLAAAWLARAATAPHPFHESLVLFWHDHFVSALSKVREGRMMLDQFALFRARGAGRFADLLDGVAKDPAMIRYLDLERSTKLAPNENFARELLELFTTGPGPYGEADVKEAARAFTGYGLRGGRFRFSEAAHDGGEKTVLGVVGPLVGEDVVRIAAARPETARFLATKIARRFLADLPTSDEIDAIATTWRRRDGVVSDVLRDLFSSAAFFSPARRRATTRCPAAFTLALLRALGVVEPPSPIDLSRRVLAMGRALFDPPSVKGYAGGAAWRHPAARLSRLDLVLTLATDPSLRATPPVLDGRDDYEASSRDLLGLVPDDREWDAVERLAARRPDSASRVRLAALLSHPEFDRC
jgi:uncharacterized protein (DUF1800 family)